MTTALALAILAVPALGITWLALFRGDWWVKKP